MLTPYFCGAGDSFPKSFRPHKPLNFDLYGSKERIIKYVSH